MRNVEATIEHLKKQIEFYKNEEGRVDSQLTAIRERLNSDKYVLELIEAEKKRNEDYVFSNNKVVGSTIAISKEQAKGIATTHTGTVDGRDTNLNL